MTFNHIEFKRQCRLATPDELAQAINKTRQSVNRKLNNPETLSVTEFLTICKLIEKDPAEFISKGETE